MTPEELLLELKSQGIKSPAVLKAFKNTDREIFVPMFNRALAYENRPLPIGEEQTVSQPYIVALSLELLDIQPTDRVLEVGTGSGYQTAMLCQLAGEVFSVEILKNLYGQGKNLLRQLGYKNLHLKHSDGGLGWEEAAPFDKIVVCAAAPRIPSPLISQLKIGGILVIPVGTHPQELIKYVKTEEGLTEKSSVMVRFVPMTGVVQNPEKSL